MPGERLIDARFLLVSGCFVLSGTAGLIYQTAWTQQFAFVFGTSHTAVATVLAAYMAGLTSGAYVAGRLLHRLRRPIWVYGILELGIALAALAVPAGIELAHRVQRSWLPDPLASTGGGGDSAFFHLVAAFVVLFPATALMGATLPILARYAVRTDHELGSRIGTLYSANTAGAAAGTLVAAFFLLPTFGLGKTVWTAVGLNLLVFVLAVLLERRSPTDRATSVESSVQKPAATGHRWILPLILISGFISFTWEVLWTRLLSHVLGGSIYAFGIMLATFLVGIAIGSWAASRWAQTPERAVVGFAAAQTAAGFCSLVAYLAVDQLPSLLVAHSSDRLLSAALASAATLLPGALCVGGTFPFAVRILADRSSDAGPASARVYAWNTLGAILGAVGTGFFLLPALQFHGTARAAVVVSFLLATITLALSRRRHWLLIPATVGVTAMVISPLPTPWSVLQTTPISGKAIEGEVDFLSVGRSSTVLVSRQPGLRRLSTNGLPESAVVPKGARVGTFSMARWLSLLPTVGRPDLDSMLIVGLGAGITLDAVPDSVREVHVVELEPEVVRANRELAHLKGQDSLSDPRVTLHLNDARSVLHLSDRQLDAIVSQPSHPWTSGASHLFTREFFELVSSRLPDSGVFVQWIGLRFVDEPLLRTLLATLTEVFPHVEVYQPPPGGALLFLAGREPLGTEDGLARGFPRFSDDWYPLGRLSAASVLVTRRLDAQGSREFGEGAMPSTDLHNLFQTRSPTAMDNPLDRRRLEPLLVELDPLLETCREDRLQRPIEMLRNLIQLRQIQRAQALVRCFSERHGEGAVTSVGHAILAASRKNKNESVRLLRRALDHPNAHGDPITVTEAEDALLLIFRQALLRGLQRPLEERLRERRGDGWWVLTALRHQSLERPQEIERLEPRLAAVTSKSALFLLATRLRIHWRRASGEPDRAAEALKLLDGLLALDGRQSPALLQRAQLAQQAGDVDALRATLQEVARNLALKPNKAVAERTRHFMSSLPAELQQAVDAEGLAQSF